MRKIGIDISLLRDFKKGMEDSLHKDYPSLDKNILNTFNFYDVREYPNRFEFGYSKDEYIVSSEQDDLEDINSIKIAQNIKNIDAFNYFLTQNSNIIYTRYRSSNTIFNTLNKYILSKKNNLRISLIGDENTTSIGWSLFFLANNKLMLSDYNLRSYDLDQRYDLIISDNPIVLDKAKNIEKIAVVNDFNKFFIRDRNKQFINIVSNLEDFLNEQI